MRRIITKVMTASEAGKPLRILIRRLTGMSSGLLTSLKHVEGTIQVNGKPVHTDFIPAEGDILTITIEDEASSENIIPVHGKPDIVYEDEDILAVNKPPHMPCHPSKGHISDSLANYTAGYYAEKGETFVFRCVTRLDRDTSGLVIITKNRLMHDLLSVQLQDGVMKKTYYAVAEGRVAPPTGRIDKNIRRLPGIASIKRETCETGDGVTAVTNYSVIAYKDGYSLLRITTETGRTHQIRVHMASVGHPLAGDWLYGNKTEEHPRQMLHCGRISLKNTLTGKDIVLSVPLPDDFGEFAKIALT